jgi:hypothetical protein
MHQPRNNARIKLQAKIKYLESAWKSVKSSYTHKDLEDQ